MKDQTTIKAYNAARMVKMRKERKETGRCMSCARPNNNQKALCNACREKRATKAQEAKKAGLCVLCLKRPVIPNLTSCPKCYQTGKRWEKATIDVRHEKAKAYRRERRERVINAYGGKCACCGEAAYEFLALDHVNGDGKQHRAKVGTTNAVLRDVERQGYPPAFRLLCHNCNSARGYYGYCPHEKLSHEKKA